MWLEELAWLWLPAVCGVGLWGLWRLVTLRVEVRALRERVERLEEEKTVRSRDQRKVA
jgi:hypothetical protein